MTPAFKPTETHRVLQALAGFAFRREVRAKNDAEKLLQRAADKAGPRRFKNEPPTGFGSLA